MEINEKTWIYTRIPESTVVINVIMMIEKKKYPVDNKTFYDKHAVLVKTSCICSTSAVVCFKSLGCSRKLAPRHQIKHVLMPLV